MSQKKAFTYKVGNYCVQEIEHLFGWDIVLSRDVGGGQYLPVSIICRREPMADWEHRRARAWAIAASSDLWGEAVNAGEALARTGLVGFHTD